jgi:hypothetical protein
MSETFRLQRGWMDSFKPQPFTEREAFLWSVENAATYGGEERLGIPHAPLARGELLTAVHKLSQAFDWSIPRVRGFLRRMERAGVWQVRPTGGGMLIIAVCAFDQHVSAASGQSI